MDESTVVFIRDVGQKSENKAQIKEDHVKFVNRTGGVVQINFKAPKDELTGIYDFFLRVNDNESLGINIVGSGDRWNHYFRGVSPIVEDEDSHNYKFHVTLQIRDAAPQSRVR
ncbi:MAG: hypothetical protein HZC47_05640 [Methanobacterium sp.]|uniref:hypothetical protein n=1 Tax=Methanobacterium sp. TaxID=2164 RepID=UPI003D661C65|nr:hypothetical protein [Methanobacterium sp.]